jgi:hypothetical protein
MPFPMENELVPYFIKLTGKGKGKGKGKAFPLLARLWPRGRAEV